MELSELTIEQLKEGRKDLVEALSSEVKESVEGANEEALSAAKEEATKAERERIAGVLEVGKEFTHVVIIQGDQTVPFELLYKVMYTCSQSQFYKMRLLTVKLEG